MVDVKERRKGCLAGQQSSELFTQRGNDESRRNGTHHSLVSMLLLKFSPVSCRSSGVALESTGNGDEAASRDKGENMSDAGCIRPNSIVDIGPGAFSEK
jgi:hypothetical protein